MISDIGLIVSIDKAANQSEKRNKSRECQVALKNLKIESAKLSSCPGGELSWTSCVGSTCGSIIPASSSTSGYLVWTMARATVATAKSQNRFFLGPNFQKKHQDTQCSGRVAKLEVPPPKCVLQSWHSRHFQWTQCCISGLTNTASHLSFGRNANVSATNLSSTRRAENISNISKTWVSGSPLCTSNNFSNTIWEYLTQTRFHLFPTLSTNPSQKLCTSLGLLFSDFSVAHWVFLVHTIKILPSNSFPLAQVSLKVRV